jgi:hypothetical protein
MSGRRKSSLLRLTRGLHLEPKPLEGRKYSEKEPYCVSPVMGRATIALSNAASENLAPKGNGCGLLTKLRGFYFGACAACAEEIPYEALPKPKLWSKRAPVPNGGQN